MTRPRSQHGFNLVELMVAIVIFAMLVGLLVPGLGKARDIARRAKCASNLKQTAVVGTNYATDFDGYFPYRTEAWVPVQVQKLNVYQGQMQPYRSGHLTDTRILSCPSSPDISWPQPFDPQANVFISYAQREEKLDPPARAYRVRTMPTAHISYLADQWYDVPTLPNTDTVPILWHQGGWNVVDFGTTVKWASKTDALTGSGFFSLDGTAQGAGWLLLDSR